MFAVPGWSVSAHTLKTQKELPAKKISDTESKAEPHAKNSKKRKRDHGSVISSDNLAELWEKHIEGRGSVKSQGQTITDDPAIAKTKRKRNRKGEDSASKRNLSNQDAEQKLEGSVGKTSTEQKALKQGKREKKAMFHSNGKAQTTISDSGAMSSTSHAAAPVSLSEPTAKPSAHPPITNHSTPPLPPTPPPQPSTLTPLQTSMRTKLLSSRFRHLNQTLYTTPSSTSLALFTQNPSLFTEYHQGFSQQVAAWPENPVDGFLQWILDRAPIGLKNAGLGTQKALFKREKKGKKEAPSLLGTPAPASPPSSNPHLDPLPRDRRSALCTIADLGCGTALLATTLHPSVKALQLHIHSFDLCASSPLVTVADISALPLPPSSVDVAVFSLALMGSNWLDFVDEAWRVLRWKGECWVAEVGSRFGGGRGSVGWSVGRRTRFGGAGVEGLGRKGKKAGDDDEEGEGDGAVVEAEMLGGAERGSRTDVSAFVEVLRRRGLVLKGEPELGNKMFVRMRFVKGLTPVRGRNALGCAEEMGREEVEVEGRVLKACVYKTR